MLVWQSKAMDWRSSLQSTLFFESVEEIYGRVFRALRPNLPLPEIEVRFRPFTTASSRIRFRNGELKVGISDLLEKAPAPVQEALAYVLLSKLFRQNVPVRAMNQYRQYLRRPEMQATIDATRRERGTKRFIGTSGNVHNLDQLFDEVNQKYFGGSIPRPRLSWSPTASRTILGHYDSAHHAIVLSRVLDHPEVPAWLVEYVMFHEVLHIKHPTENAKGPQARRRVHTRAFREEEKTFPRFPEVKEALRRLP
jgi:hypothetical protein